jgi:hypothetical protein
MFGRLRPVRDKRKHILGDFAHLKSFSPLPARHTTAAWSSAVACRGGFLGISPGKLHDVLVEDQWGSTLESGGLLQLLPPLRTDPVRTATKCGRGERAGDGGDDDDDAAEPRTIQPARLSSGPQSGSALPTTPST